MRYFVTGATGFVGANVVRDLVKQRGNEVHIIARKSSDLWRIKDVLPRLRRHLCNLEDYPRLRRTVKKIRPEVILHFATYGSYLDLERDEDRILRTNYIGTANLLRAAEDIPYRCFVHTGSSSEYGAKKRPMKETDVPEPLNLYAAAKAASTLLCQSYARTKGKNVVCVRLFSVYGYYEEAFRLVAQAVRHCLAGRDLNLTAGFQKRDFIFVEDLNDAFRKIVRTRGLGGEILNLGTGTEHSVRQVARMIRRLTGAGNELNFGKRKTRAIEYKRWVADVTKTQRLLGWRARYSLDEGLKRTIAWFRENNRLYC